MLAAREVGGIPAPGVDVLAVSGLQRVQRSVECGSDDVIALFERDGGPYRLSMVVSSGDWSAGKSQLTIVAWWCSARRMSASARRMS